MQVCDSVPLKLVWHPPSLLQDCLNAQQGVRYESPCDLRTNSRA